MRIRSICGIRGSPRHPPCQHTATCNLHPELRRLGDAAKTEVVDTEVGGAPEMISGANEPLIEGAPRAAMNDAVTPRTGSFWIILKSDSLSLLGMGRTSRLGTRLSRLPLYFPAITRIIVLQHYEELPFVIAGRKAPKQSQ